MSNCPGDRLLMGAFSSCLSALKLSEILCRDKQFLVSALKANICCSLVCSESCRCGDGEVSDQTPRGWWRRATEVPSNVRSVQHCHGKTSFSMVLHLHPAPRRSGASTMSPCWLWSHPAPKCLSSSSVWPWWFLNAGGQREALSCMGTLGLESFMGEGLGELREMDAPCCWDGHLWKLQVLEVHIWGKCSRGGRIIIKENLRADFLFLQLRRLHWDHIPRGHTTEVGEIWGCPPEGKGRYGSGEPFAFLCHCA